MGWPTTSQGMGQLGEGLDIGFTPSIGCITHEDMLSMIWWKLFVVCQIYFQLFGLSRVASSFFSVLVCETAKDVKNKKMLI